jgi:2,4-dienoyl-CoA reductase-like NADH-dependent reductase (Old Yellow Enzyme family)
MMVEVTSVSAEGRIILQISGLYLQLQVELLKRIVTFAHSQNQKIGIQLAYVGRKASSNAPWLEHTLASKELGE